MQIAHITLNVKDIAESIHFYTEVTGIRIQKDLRTHGMPIVFMADDESLTEIELIENEKNAYQGFGISIGFQVHSIDAEYSRLKDLGYRISDIVSPGPAPKFFFVSDPDGVKIQLIEG